MHYVPCCFPRLNFVVTKSIVRHSEHVVYLDLLCCCAWTFWLVAACVRLLGA
jgi:hypothetical protein